MPPGPGDDAEGQLKPIAEFLQAPPATAGATATRAPIELRPTPAPTPAPAPTPPPVAAGPVRRTTLGGPRLSLNLNARGEETGKLADNTTSAPRNTREFTTAEFDAAWKAYIDSHSHDHLLINTMRASHPAPDGRGNYVMIVESDIQVELMAGAMQSLLDTLHAALGNDVFRIEVRANTGVSSPATWNEREVLADIAKRHPAMSDFLTKLHLKLS